VSKDQIIQFKLKVDLSSEVLVKVNEGGEGEPAGQGAEVRRQNEIFSTVKGVVADKMLKDDRQEESKEKPDI
jgi:hypothetical protein